MWAYFAALQGLGGWTALHHFEASASIFILSNIMLLTKIITESAKAESEHRAAFLTLVLCLLAGFTFVEMGLAKGEYMVPGFAGHPGPILVEPRREQQPPKVMLPKPASRKPAPKPQPKPKEQPPVISVAARYGNLGARCTDLGDTLVAYADSQDKVRPNPSTNKYAYNEWIRTTDGTMRFREGQEIDSLQKDLNAADLRNTELDEYLQRYREAFQFRNGSRGSVCVSSPEFGPCYIQTYDIRKIGQLFRYLATQIPKT